MTVTIGPQQVFDHTVKGYPTDRELSFTTVDQAHESEAVVNWLGRLRLLHGVPFEYMIADDGLLRPETIRFLYFDRNWTDALVDGAIAAGTFSTRERAQVTASHGIIRAAVDVAERNQWIDDVGSAPDAAPVTGFLLRSRAVSGWPGMHVRAFRKTGGTQRRLSALRIERLSPAVMIALFDDQPTSVQLEEPRQGIQFGVTPADGVALGRRWKLAVRDPATGIEAQGRTPVTVPFRRGSAGVVHMTQLAKRIVDDHRDLVGDSLSSNELALQLLRYPYRQRFGDRPSGGYLDYLDATVGFEELHLWNERIQ